MRAFTQLVTPGFLAIMLYKQYGDGGEDDEEEKDLPEFVEGDSYGLFSSGSKKVRPILSYSRCVELCII